MKKPHLSNKMTTLNPKIQHGHISTISTTLQNEHSLLQPTKSHFHLVPAP